MMSVPERITRTRLRSSVRRGVGILAFAAGVLLLVSACASSRGGQVVPIGADPVRSDPPASLRPPGKMDELHLLSGGARINGLLYEAPGPGPHPIVLFLHGFPGNERNLDLAQAVRRAGYHALYIDYRGNFGSGGTFSHANSLEDVITALRWIRSPEADHAYGIDPARIAVLGHSFGGWLALLATEHEPPGLCVAAIAAWNAGWVASRFASFPQERAAVLQDYTDATDPAGGPIRADATALVTELSSHQADWNYLEHAQSLTIRPLLLVAAARDTPDEDVPMHAELTRAIQRAGGHHVRFVSFEDDHPFSSHRIALAETIIDWLRHDCAAAWPHARNPL